MKIHPLATVSTLLFFSSIAFCQQAKLEGGVIDDRTSPVANVRVVAPGGQAAVTDSRGHFLISFPSTVLPGQATRIEVERPGWVVFEPLLGNCVIQSSARNYEPLKVVIVPKGSPLALGPKRLNQVIRQWANERVKLQAQVAHAKGELDEYAFLREYSDKYGFTLDQFLIAAKQWAQSTESDDKEEQAVKEYFLKNYDRAAQLAHESEPEADDELERANQSKKDASLKVIRRYKLEGNALSAQSRFREALAAYKEIDGRFLSKKLSKEDLSLEWAETKVLLGDTEDELATRVEGSESRLLWSASVESYRQALTVYTYEQSPQDWAMTQNNLGIALRNQGERTSGEESVRLLGQAVGALREALNVYTRDQLAQDWAATQNNLGNALVDEGERASGEESVRLWGQAVGAFREALKVRTPDQWPQDWAMTQNNLGNALLNQGERASGEESVRLLGQAVDAFREALKVRTRDQLPQQWAATQNNLGVALTDQGERVSGEESVRLLGQAVDAFREALKVYTRDQLPQDWAMTQNNLGNALLNQGERVSGEESVRLLGQAVDALREALKVYTRDQLPQQWATTQDNLGSALQDQGEWADGEESVRLLVQAVDAFKEALKVRTQDQLPQDWAMTQNNLGNALVDQGEQASGEESARLLGQAVDAFKEALKVRTQDQLPQDWAMTQNNVGNALVDQGEQASGEESARLLGQAVDAFQEALKVRTRDQLPQQWAATQNNLGVALTDQGERASGEESVRLLGQAVGAFREALKLRTRERLPQAWVQTEKNLANAQWLLQNWADAAGLYITVLQFYPDNEGAYTRATFIYHEILFNYSSAFVLNREWLARHPADNSAQINLTEKQFTTARFSDFEENLKVVLAKENITPSSSIALQTIGVANLLALGQTTWARARLDAVIEQVARQALEFEIEKSFSGTRHFAAGNEKLGRYREWLDELFDAVTSNESRDTILTSLKQVRLKFQE
jgi:tetratricopeptide (TPR) repeat protein